MRDGKIKHTKQCCHEIGLGFYKSKGTATQMNTMFYMKDLNKPCILIPDSYKSVEKQRSCRRLNICKWTVMEVAIL